MRGVDCVKYFKVTKVFNLYLRDNTLRLFFSSLKTSAPIFASVKVQ